MRRVKIAGADPDFHRRDLWEAIEAGDYPEWELGVQVFTEEQAEASSTSMCWMPPSSFPRNSSRSSRRPDGPEPQSGQLLRRDRAGRLLHRAHRTRHRFHATIRCCRAASTPMSTPRLSGWADRISTRFRSTRPLAQVHNNQRDGMHRQAIPRGRVSYEPNSLGGGCPFQAGSSRFQSFPQPFEDDKVRGKPEKFAEHYNQATLFWNSQSDPEKQHIIRAFRFELTKVQVNTVRVRVVAQLRNVAEELAQGVADGLGLKELPEPLPRVLKRTPRPEIDSLRSLVASGKTRY